MIICWECTHVPRRPYLVINRLLGIQVYDLYLKSLQTNNIHIIHQHPSGAETRLYVPGRGGPLVWGDMEGRYNQIVIICHHRHQPTFWQTLVYIRPK